jgi:hypothetical protein
MAREATGHVDVRDGGAGDSVPATRRLPNGSKTTSMTSLDARTCDARRQQRDADPPFHVGPRFASRAYMAILSRVMRLALGWRFCR